jgi:hypothetical protein
MEGNRHRTVFKETPGQRRTTRSTVHPKNDRVVVRWCDRLEQPEHKLPTVVVVIVIVVVVRRIVLLLRRSRCRRRRHPWCRRDQSGVHVTMECIKFRGHQNHII